MVYSGGPYLQLGTILSANVIGPLNLPYGRVTDRLQDVMDNLYTNFVPWEWWIDYTGKVQMGVTRGRDKTGVINIVHGQRLNAVDAERSIKQTAQRVRVTGSGEGREQDDATSDWQNDTTAMDAINTFYEVIDGNKEISQKEMADVLAKVLLTTLKDPREEITINDVDLLPFTANDYDVGDSITVTDPWTQLSSSYIIKTIEKTVDSEGGETPNLTLSKKRTDISDRLANLQKQLDKITTSNTAISRLLNIGGKQDKIDPNKLEDVWEITAKNKYAISMPEDSSKGADDENITYTETTGTGTYSCSKDEFNIQTLGATGDDLRLHNTLVDLDWENNPKFSCEFELDTDVGVAWEETDQVDIVVEDTALSRGFGFQIEYSGSTFHIWIVLMTGITYSGEASGLQRIEILPTGGISYDTKYRIAAEVDWENKVVRYSFGSPSQDFAIVGILPIPLTEPATGQTMHPMFVRLQDAGANNILVYFFNWKTQAKALYTS